MTEIFPNLTQEDRTLLKEIYFKEDLRKNRSLEQVVRDFLYLSDKCAEFDGFIKPNGTYFNDPMIVQRGTNFGKSLKELSLIQLQNYSASYAKQFGQEDIVKELILAKKELAD